MPGFFSLPPPSVTLALGGLTTSYVFFSSVTDMNRGIIPLLNDRFGAVDIDEKKKIEMWSIYFKRASTGLVGGSVLSALLNFTTAYIHPSPLTRRITFISAVTSLLIVPITFASGILPINNRLFEIAKGAETTRDDEVKSLVKTWGEKHLLRMPAYTAAWVLSFFALVYDGRI
ncbi:hypothetical protein J008_06966 [Cryptococcus neoformans]|uniref:Integral membrane protein n=2 Tax=Cryptococcus neoformans TaxID=5207 RepID=A0A854QG47_CRYNE|nr:hypothetical protein CNAG_05544 [Cryptococcus neoformans var. grubii H99]AUB29197.1 hypothetical protein CKF44_05544 [Cryptococcus neoformans var. grubii]OWZ25917.1 hypothetical protein C347_06886 [Cryptococcus neoformans var. grubii AD2-60a]OWZ26046.1 hypothetical protein C353_06997 [Cryptococcus neoformans var. grubii AD1-83a]OWZ37946.1 hypothetical protein C343_06959 [Cryptococcus neoformans var. grubii C23]OWZ49689.1 hypothetical protein C368_06963 [Cryptococcus neoformans var. grubii 1|eukprot:XP_012053839.1 hypothetical protein CNAG_05544 [Cryptococcus neoformans var. grubii H99]